jgi:hypothetical protein
MMRGDWPCGCNLSCFFYAMITNKRIDIPFVMYLVGENVLVGENPLELVDVAQVAVCLQGVHGSILQLGASEPILRVLCQVEDILVCLLVLLVRGNGARLRLVCMVSLWCVSVVWYVVCVVCQCVVSVCCVWCVSVSVCQCAWSVCGVSVCCVCGMYGVWCVVM